MTIMELEREIHQLKNQLYADHERLNYLERELNLIKQSAMQQQVPPMRQMQLQGQMPLQGQIPPQQQRPPMPEVSSQPQRPPMPLQGQVPPQPQRPPMPEKMFDIERFIGKSWMGIMASVLIFISIILFAVTLLPYLTDTIKMCIMYAVSIAFVIVGLVLFKKVGKIFYMILSACGMGALYISMLFSNIYFKAIGDVTLYIFILTWAVGIAIVAKNNIRTFSIVGNVGIVIAVLLGTVKCISAEDSMKFTVLLLFFVLSAVIYGIINNRFYFSNIISNMVGMMILAGGYIALDAANVVLFSLLLVSCIAQLIYLTYKQIRTYFVFHLLHLWGILGLVWSLIYLNEAWMNQFEFRLNDYVFAFIIYAISIVSIVFMEFFHRVLKEIDHYHSKDIIQIVDMGTIIIALLRLDINSICFLILVPVVFLVISFFKKDEKFTIAAVVALVLSVFGNDSIVAGIMIFVIAAGIVAMKQKAEDEASDYFRAVAGVIMRISLVQFVYEIYDTLKWNESVCVTLILFFILVIDLTFKYVLSHGKKDKAIVVVSDVSGILCALVVTAKLLWADEGLIYYITVLVGCAIFMNNVVSYIKSRQVWKQVYAMIKVSCYLVIILASLEQVSIALSIVFFIVAILWVLLGFRIDAKAVRLYGLVTSLISIAKLILIDIQYNSSLGKALGFFVCGILAFVISFIYNRFEKNNSKLEES